MTNPIIDPSTLSEKQREWLRMEYHTRRRQIEKIKRSGSYGYDGLLGSLSMMERIFGFPIFQQKGE